MLTKVFPGVMFVVIFVVSKIYLSGYGFATLSSGKVLQISWSVVIISVLTPV